MAGHGYAYQPVAGGGHWYAVVNGSTRTLDDLMEINHVVRVDETGMVWDDVEGVYAPEVIATTDDDGNFTPTTERELAARLKEAGWTAANGWSAQHMTRGDDIVMHSSEFIGGGIGRYMLDTPGYWVCCMATCDNGEEDDNVAGWVLLHKEIA